MALTDDAAPLLGAKSRAMHAEKMARDPDWAALLAAISDVQLQGGR
ncbi:hypothetical protein [Corallococcus exiguus]|nr:hypothetical protein [Corallococcus exiguus]NRD57034.1 hypothetical protein [Corallococcus exiguus]